MGVLTSKKTLGSTQFRRITNYCFSKVDKKQINGFIHMIISEIDTKFVS